MTGSWTRSEKRGTYREWKRIRSGRGTPVDTLQGGGGDTRRKKSPLLRVSTVNSIAFYLMPAVLKEMMSARDTCSIEFKTGRSSDIYGYVENGSVDVALVSDLLNSRRIVPFPVFREPFVFADGFRRMQIRVSQRIRWNFWNIF